MPAAKRNSSSRGPTWSAFRVHWWHTDEEKHVYRYQTTGPADIREISDTHLVVNAHPRRVPEDGEEPVQIILRFEKGLWILKLDDYETDYPFHADDGETAVWTCADDDELLVVRGMR